MQLQSDNCPIGTNSDDLYIHIATAGNTIQTVNSPMYDTYMSTPGNTAKLGTAHSNIQTAQSNPSLVGNEPTMHLVSILPSQHSIPTIPATFLRYRTVFTYQNSIIWTEHFTLSYYTAVIT